MQFKSGDIVQYTLDTYRSGTIYCVVIYKRAKTYILRTDKGLIISSTKRKLKKVSQYERLKYKLNKLLSETHFQD